MFERNRIQVSWIFLGVAFAGCTLFASSAIAEESTLLADNNVTLAAGNTVPASDEHSTLAWEPYAYETREGDPVTDAERAWLRVPENRETPGDQSIELHVIRFKATAPDPGPPIVWLAGGPGDFGSDDIEGPYLELVRTFQEIADVIVLDQRGSGLSKPLLTCPEAEVMLPFDRALERESLIDAHRTVSRDCAAYWEGEGVDLTAYNTAENAHDIEDLRRALGAQNVTLYGGSYGTHLGLAMIRLHPASVHRAILSGVEGPDHTLKLPSVIEAHFAEVVRAHAVAEEEGPDLLSLMRRVVRRLDEAPVTVAVEGDEDTVQVVVGGFDLRMANRYFLGSVDNIRQIPAIYRAMDGGDYSVLGSIAVSFRSVSTWSAMYYAMDCASGATPERLARIEAESSLPLSLTGAALNGVFPEVCDAWPHRDLGPRFRAPITSDIPVLMISGTLDGQTPVSNVSELLPGFPNARHLIVENGSHTYLELSHPAIQEAMLKFLKGEELGGLVVRNEAVFGGVDDEEEQ